MEFNKILVPVDGSARSELVVNLAVNSAKDFGSDITFLYVVDVGKSNWFGTIDQNAELMKLDMEGRIALDSVERMAKAAGINFELKKVTGIPGEVICEMSKDYNQIILGVTGKSGMRAGQIGRTAAFVIENSECPVLSIKFDSKKLESILLPVDSIHTAAIDLAIASAKNAGARIVVLSVKKDNDPTDLVNAVVAKCKEAGVEAEGKILTGKPAEVIVAESGNHNLVVMGTEGRSGLRKVLRGSTTEAVVANAACAVTTIRED